MTDISLKKLPPTAIMAEQYVLGAILLNSKAYYSADCIITAADFYNSANRIIYRAFVELFSSGKDEADLVLVSDYLKQQDKLETVGGTQYLMQLLESVPSAYHIKHHAKLIKEKSTLRAMAALGNLLYTSAYQDNQDVNELMAETEKRFFELSLQGKGYDIQADVLSPREIADQALASIDVGMIKQNKGIQVGFPEYDKSTNGLPDVTILSASTGIGKTGLALNWAVNIGIKQHIHALYINYEMAKEELIYRILGIVSGIPIQEIKSGEYSHPENINWVVEKIAMINESQLFITDNAAKDINTTISLINQYKIQHGIKVVFIDYLGEIMPTVQEIKEKEYLTYGRWVSDLKGICTKLNIKLIIMAQLNREGEESPRRDKVAGSWKMVQKSDIFNILYLAKGGAVTLKIAKQRHGQYPLSIELNYNRETQEIKEIGLSEEKSDSGS